MSRDEEGAGAGEGVDEEARALVGGGLGDLGLLEPTGDGIQHLGEAADSEGAFVLRAMRVHGGLLGGEEEDVVEVSWCGQLGGADGEGGLAHAARAINERAPTGRVGMEIGEELGEFGVATEEALDGGEVVAGEGQRWESALRGESDGSGQASRPALFCGGRVRR